MHPSVRKFWAIILDKMVQIYFKGFANTSVMMSLKIANENFALKVQTIETIMLIIGLRKNGCLKFLHNFFDI